MNNKNNNQHEPLTKADKCIYEILTHIACAAFALLVIVLLSA